MWTPKRVLVYLAGLVAFFVGYAVYAHFLGGIDGLSALPHEFLPDTTAEETNDPGPPVPPNLADTKLKMAFGDHSEVLKRSIKVEMPRKNMVVAAEEFFVQDDGRVQLKRFHVALFGKTDRETLMPEINTVSSDVAYITFDKKITNYIEMGSRKIVAGELVGNVWIINNRKTLRRDDDLSLFTQGPLYFRDNERSAPDKDTQPNSLEGTKSIWADIWTKAEIRIKDLQSLPPMEISGTGMDVYLTKETNPPQSPPTGPQKAKSENLGGLERVELRAFVEMHLWVDSHSGGFLSIGKAEAKNKTGDQRPGPGVPAPATRPPASGSQALASTAQPSAAKSHVVINNDGPFTYDAVKDQAHFELSPRPSLFPKGVQVKRENEPGQWDQLDCDHLDLQFNRKGQAAKASAPPQPNPPPQVGGGQREGELEIVSAHATAVKGKEVVLTSDTQMLEAHGRDLYYDTPTKTTILRGDNKPMWAVREGNLLNARELHLVEVNGSQQATAYGPGNIQMFSKGDDKSADKRSLIATWKDKLVTTKEGGLDCMTLTGGASFEDHEQNQDLKGDLLKVWLEPAENGSSNANSQQRVRPHHVEAQGHVTANSADLIVKEPTESLTFWFKDAPPRMIGVLEGPKPAAPVASRVGNGTDSSREPPLPRMQLGGGPQTPSPSLTLPPEPQADTSKTKKPIDLSARSIKAYVLRGETKNELDKLWCEGTVRVHQDPSGPDDKGMDIRGETLQLYHALEGDKLIVSGSTSGDLAEVKQDQMAILGPEVTIDQRTNIANVNGMGLMKMPSNTSFNGAKLAKPSLLTIIWTKEMFFDGKNGSFDGDIRATQDNARMSCKNLQFVLDRPVSFKQQVDKGKEPSKIQRLMCDKQVFIEDTIMEGNRLVEYKRIVALALSVDNQLGRAEARGPGIVHILRMGAVDQQGAGAANEKKPNHPAAAQSKPKEEMKLTRVIFRDSMHADNNKGIATFYGDVKVIHVPTENPDLDVDLDHPPPGLLFMTCEQLKVFDHKNNREMEGRDRVVVEAQDGVSATAFEVKYDEAQERLIFVGREGNPAVLNHQKVRGKAPDKITGQKIFYWRRDGTIKVEKGGSFNSH